jgi:GDP-mannose 6-dehydrogenase
MRIIVWGLGHVGTVSAACLARLGHEVVGVEPDSSRLEAVRNGRCAFKEPGLEELVRAAVSEGRLRATGDGRGLLAWADVSLICVGTPAAGTGAASLNDLGRVAEEIGQGLGGADTRHVVALRSTVFPGVARDFVLPLLERTSGRKAGRDFGLVVNPEFLREANAISDFWEPPYVVIGEFDSRSGDVIEALNEGINAPVYRVRPEEAELLKLTSNAFHGLKVGFANEVGRLCERLGLDGHTLMRMLCADTKLNISPAYLRPGFAFGGPCLPKDLRCLTSNARSLGVPLPILEAVLPSNRLQLEAAIRKIRELKTRRVGILGLGFKPGTDDVRVSPVVDLIRALARDGITVLVYDPDVRPGSLNGDCRAYLEDRLPTLERSLCSGIDEVLGGCRAVVVCQDRPEFAAALSELRDRGDDFAVLDLVRPGDEQSLSGTGHEVPFR